MMKKLSVSRRGFLIAIAFGASSLLVGNVAIAEKLNLSGGVAISGYDPVAYFTKNAAIKGDQAYEANYHGAKYLFESAENRDAFNANPAKFAPKYGGFCAYAVSQGYTAPIDPQAFTVVDDRLYLNFSKGVRSRWEKDIPGNIKKGDENWPNLSAS